MGTHKAIIQGECIAESTHLKRRRTEARLRLHQELRETELKLQLANTIPQLRRVILLWRTLKDLEVGKIKKAMQALKDIITKKLLRQERS